MARRLNPGRVDQSYGCDLDYLPSLCERTAITAIGRMSTPLARVRGLWAAKSGTELFSRPLHDALPIPNASAGIGLFMISVIGRNHAAVVQILGSPLIAVIMLL